MRTLRIAVVVLAGLVVLALLFPSGPRSVVPIFVSSRSGVPANLAGAEKRVSTTAKKKAEAERRLDADVRYAKKYESAAGKVPKDLAADVATEKAKLDALTTELSTETTAAETLGVEAGIPATAVEADLAAEEAALGVADAEVLAEAEAVLELAVL